MMNPIHDEAIAGAALNGTSSTIHGASHHDTPTLVIEPQKGWSALRLHEIWEYRELLLLLAKRDVTVRYKQTVFGAAWAIVQPIFTMVVFTVVFGGFAGFSNDRAMEHDGKNIYPIFAFTALLPWNYFSRALGGVISSMVGSGHLIQKVYFPRLIPPLVAVMTPAVDFGISFLVLIGMMIYFSMAPTVGVLMLPVFLLFAALTALAVGLWLAAVNVKYRDIGHLMGHISTLWMYASPIIYPLEKVAEKAPDWLFLYSLNPMVSVIEGFRWALVGKSPPDFTAMAVSASMVFVLLFGGLMFFKRTERQFADVV
jgi:lipopolysaccharide transport system permease protein